MSTSTQRKLKVKHPLFSDGIPSASSLKAQSQASAKANAPTATPVFSTALHVKQQGMFVRVYQLHIIQLCY